MATGSADRTQLPKAVAEGATGSGLAVLLLGIFIEESVKTLIPVTGRWFLALALFLLVFGLFIIPLIRRSRLRKSSPEIRQILLRREVDKSPWQVAAVIVVALLVTELVVSGALGFLFGLLLPQVVENGAISQEALAIISLSTAAVVLLVSLWSGRYATHRIAGREIWWTLGGILSYRLILSLPLNLFVGMPIELMPWLAYTGALLVAGWMGHRLGRRTEPYFTMSYLFGLLSPENQAHLLDLAGSVALGPPGGEAAEGAEPDVIP